jgi:hypothetical protein
VLQVYLCRRYVTDLIHGDCCRGWCLVHISRVFLLLFSLYHRIHAHGSPQLPYRNNSAAKERYAKTRVRFGEKREGKSLAYIQKTSAISSGMPLPLFPTRYWMLTHESAQPSPFQTMCTDQRSGRQGLASGRWRPSKWWPWFLFFCFNHTVFTLLRVWQTPKPLRLRAGRLDGGAPHDDVGPSKSGD